MKQIKKYGCVVLCVVLVAICWASYELAQVFVPRVVNESEGPEMFAIYAYDPPPQGVTDMKASGVIAFTGSEVKVSFSVTKQSVFDDVVRAGGFHEVKQMSQGQADALRGMVAGGEIFHKRYEGGGASNVFLVFNNETLRGVLIYYGN